MNTPKDFRDAVGTATLETVCKPITKLDLKPGQGVREFIESTYYKRITERLREDFCQALVKGESLEQFIERIKTREEWQ